MDIAYNLQSENEEIRSDAILKMIDIVDFNDVFAKIVDMLQTGELLEQSKINLMKALLWIMKSKNLDSEYNLDLFLRLIKLSLNFIVHCNDEQLSLISSEVCSISYVMYSCDDDFEIVLLINNIFGFYIDDSIINSLCLLLSSIMDFLPIDDEILCKVLNTILNQLQIDHDVYVINNLIKMISIDFIGIFSDCKNLFDRTIHIILGFIDKRECIVTVCKWLLKFIPFSNILSMHVDLISKNIIQILNLNDNDIQIQLCLVIKKFFDHFEKYTFNIDFIDCVSNFLFLLIQKCQQECDLRTDWEPHISALFALSSMINYIDIDLFIPINSFLYQERYAGLVVLTLLFKKSCFKELFLKIFKKLLELIKDPIPRVRKQTIICLTQGISKYHYRIKNYINENYELFLEKIYYALNDDINVSIELYPLSYLLFIFSNFQFNNEILYSLISNLPKFENMIMEKHFNYIRKMIKVSHISVLSIFENVYCIFINCLYSLKKFYWLIYDFSKIIAAFIKRLKKELLPFYAGLSSTFLELSKISNDFSSINPLSNIICYINFEDKIFIQETIQLYINLYENYNDNYLCINDLCISLKKLIKFNILDKEIIYNFIEFHGKFIDNINIPMISKILVYDVLLIEVLQIKDKINEIKNFIFQVFLKINDFIEKEEIEYDNSFITKSIVSSMVSIIKLLNNQEISEISSIILSLLFSLIENTKNSRNVLYNSIEILLYFSNHFKNDLISILLDENDSFQQFLEYTSKYPNLFDSVNTIFKNIGFSSKSEF